MEDRLCPVQNVFYPIPVNQPLDLSSRDSPVHQLGGSVALNYAETWERLQDLLSGKPSGEQDELKRLHQELALSHDLRQELVKKNDLQIRKLTKELAKKEQENEYCRDRSNSEIKALRERMLHKEEALEYLEKMSAEIKNLEKENCALKNEVNRFNSAVTELNTKLKSRSDAAMTDHVKLKKKLKSKEKQFELEIGERDARIQVLTSEVADVKSRTSFLRFQNLALKSDLEKKREEIVNLQRRADDLTAAKERNQRSEKVQVEFRDLEKNHQTVCSENGDLKKCINELKEKLSTISKTNIHQGSHGTSRDTVELESQIRKLKSKVSHLETGRELATLRGKVKERDHRIVQLERDFSTAEEHLRSRTTEFDKDNQALRDQIRVLKSKVELSEVNNVEKTKEELSRVKQKLNVETGRVTELEKCCKGSEEDVKLWRDQVNSLECRVFDIEKENAELRQLRVKITEQRQRIVELGEHPDPIHFRPLEEKIAELIEDKKRLIDQVKSHENGVLCLTKETNDTQRQCRVLQGQLTDSRDNYKRLLKDNAELRKRQSDRLVEIKRLNDCLSKARQECKHLQAERSRLLDENLARSRKEQEIKLLDQVIQDLGEKVKVAEAEKSDVENRMKVMSEVKEEIVKKQMKDSENLEKALKAKTEEVDQWKNMVNIVTDEKRNLFQMHSMEVEKVKQSEQKLESVTKDRDKWQHMVNVLTSQKQEMLKKHSAEILRLKESCSGLAVVTRERDKLLERLTAATKEKEILVRKLEDESKKIKTASCKLQYTVKERDEMKAKLNQYKDQEKILKVTKKEIADLKSDRGDLNDLRDKLSEVMRDRDLAEASMRTLQRELANRNQTIKMLRTDLRTSGREMERDARGHGRSYERDERSISNEHDRRQEEWPSDHRRVEWDNDQHARVNARHLVPIMPLIGVDDFNSISVVNRPRNDDEPGMWNELRDPMPWTRGDARDAPWGGPSIRGDPPRENDVRREKVMKCPSCPGEFNSRFDRNHHFCEDFI